MASKLYRWCPRGCGKKVWYAGTNTKFKRGYWECQECFFKFSTEEMVRLGFVKKKSNNTYKPKKQYNILRLVKG
jgi:hypothetical protein